MNANVKAGTRVRHEILLRKAFLYDSALADAFGIAAVASSGVSTRVAELGEAMAEQIGRLNTAYAAKHGCDLFKSTNKTTQALLKLGRPVKDIASYKAFIGDLYFVFKEGVGQRLDGKMPPSFTDVNTLRTALQHDIDHGVAGKVSSKNKKIGAIFEKYAGTASPEVLDESRFVLVQANLLSAIELDLQTLAT